MRNYWFSYFLYLTCAQPINLATAYWGSGSKDNLVLRSHCYELNVFYGEKILILLEDMDFSTIWTFSLIISRIIFSFLPLFLFIRLHRSSPIYRIVNEVAFHHAIVKWKNFDVVIFVNPGCFWLIQAQEDKKVYKWT